MSESPLNFDSSTLPCGVCAMRSPTMSLAATAMPESGDGLDEVSAFHFLSSRGGWFAAALISSVTDNESGTMLTMAR